MSCACNALYLILGTLRMQWHWVVGNKYEQVTTFMGILDLRSKYVEHVIQFWNGISL